MGILKKGSVPELEIEPDHERFPGFMVTVRWLSPDRLTKLREQCTTNKRRRGRPEEKLDSDRLSELMMEEMVTGWRGFKPEYVAAMMPVDPESMAEIVRRGELPFSYDDLRMLGECAYSRDFSDVIMEIGTDLDLLLKAKSEAARKNSGGSQLTTATAAGPEAASTAKLSATPE